MEAIHTHTARLKWCGRVLCFKRRERIYRSIFWNRRVPYYRQTEADHYTSIFSRLFSVNVKRLQFCMSVMYMFVYVYVYTARHNSACSQAHTSKSVDSTTLAVRLLLRHIVDVCVAVRSGSRVRSSLVENDTTATNDSSATNDASAYTHTHMNSTSVREFWTNVERSYIFTHTHTYTHSLRSIQAYMYACACMSVGRPMMPHYWNVLCRTQFTCEGDCVLTLVSCPLKCLFKKKTPSSRSWYVFLWCVLAISHIVIEKFVLFSSGKFSFFCSISFGRNWDPLCVCEKWR